MPNNFDKLFNQQQGNDLINALKGIKSSLDVNYPLETVNVTLSNNAQNITPSENYYGLGQVNVPGMNLSDITILVNGNYDPVTSGLDGYGKLNVNVPTWGQADEGKVVSNNALVPQTNREVNANGTYDTTLNNSVLVNVPNTYGSEDEGKVVMNNALVPQTNRSITENGTYDTTTNDEVVVDVQCGGDAKIYRFIDETYYMDETGLICTIDGRTYTKIYSDPAFVAYFYNGSYTGPVLVSKTENGAVHQTSISTTPFSPTQETIDGETWYVSQFGYPMAGDKISTDGYATKLTGSYATPKLAAEALLQLAYDNPITENGSYTVPEGYDGFGDFNVDVEANTETLRVTQNGTYTPSTGKDGFSRVAVNVQGGGGGSKNILSGTEAPTSSLGEDGDIYLRYGDEILSDFQIKNESSTMTITVNDSNIVFDYTGGVDIGGQAYKQFDLTNVDTISFSITSGSHTYNNYQTPKFCPLVIIENTLNPASNFVANTLSPVEGSRITANNTNVTMDVDVSSLTGNYWIVFCSYGCDSTVDFLNCGNNNINNTFLKADNAWQNLIGSDIDDVNTEGSGGAKNILGGTTNPTSADGTDGDIYIKYSDYSDLSGYTVLEYLQSSGTQWIDTGVPARVQQKAEIDCQWLSSGDQTVLGGSSNVNNNAIFLGYNSSNNRTYVGYANSWHDFNSGAVNQNRHKWIIDLKNNQQTMMVDDSQFATTSNSFSETTSTTNLFMFARSTGASAFIGRIYNVKIYDYLDNGNLIRDFIPVKRNSDDVLGMYDLVNDVFYTNSGTGEFIGGSELTGTPIDTVYLKSNGSWGILEDGDWSNVTKDGKNKNILSGTTTPTSGQGANGDIYIKYTEYSEIEGYSILEYLGVGDTAGPYIDTGISNTSTAYFEVDAQWTESPSNNNAVFGAQTANEYAINAWQGTAFVAVKVHANINTPLNRHRYKADSNGIYIDDVLTATPNWDYATNRNYYLFANNYSGGVLSGSGIKIYKVKLWNGNTLVRDFVPVKRNSDDVLGMYDLVNDVFYTNSGTGSFIGGEELTGTPIDTVYLKVDGDWIILEDGDYSEVNTEGGSGKLYTNSKFYESDVQITDVTGFTKVYNTSVRYGNNGAKVSARLDVTDESAIETFMSGGWSASEMAYYDSENLIGAYGGYDFGEELDIYKVKLWIGRYSAQNDNLNVTLQWLDENGVWNDILQDLQVTTALSYPVNVFERIINLSCYGIRWIHEHTPNKTSGNNIIFAGMTIYEGTGESIDVYTPTQTGLIQVPTGYDGFGPIYITP